MEDVAAAEDEVVVDAELEVDEVEDELEDDEVAPFLWNKVNLQLPPQISDASPTQLDKQSVTATLVFVFNVVPQ